MNDKFLLNLGLAHRAGKLRMGTENVRDSIKKCCAVQVFIARDVSENTKKEISDSANYYNTPCEVIPYTMNELSVCLGKDSLVSAVSLTDIGFKNLILKNLHHQEV